MSVCKDVPYFRIYLHFCEISLTKSYGKFLRDLNRTNRLLPADAVGHVVMIARYDLFLSTQRPVKLNIAGIN